jgi:hypothetical protein
VPLGEDLRREARDLLGVSDARLQRQAATTEGEELEEGCMSEDAPTYASLPAIAGKLAMALRMMPCRCIEVGTWPLFKAEAAGTPDKPGKHVPKTCSKCEALAEYDAHVSIVQTPASAALAAGSLATQIESAKRSLRETPDYLKGAAAEALQSRDPDQVGERND